MAAWRIVRTTTIFRQPDGGWSYSPSGCTTQWNSIDMAPAKRQGDVMGPGVLAAASLVSLFVLIGADPVGQTPLPAATAAPGAVGVVLFGDYWLAVEAVSILLFAALAAVMLLGRGKTGRKIVAGGRAA